MKTPEISIYEVDVRYCSGTGCLDECWITNRFKTASEAYDFFLRKKEDGRVWQLKFRTIQRYGFVSDSVGEFLAFKEETTRETHWINPNGFHYYG